MAKPLDLDAMQRQMAGRIPGARFVGAPVGFGWAPSRHLRAQLVVRGAVRKVVLKRGLDEQGFRTESCAYRRILPNIAIRTPELICSVSVDANSWLLLEDVGGRHSRSGSREDRESFLTLLGTLHAQASDVLSRDGSLHRDMLSFEDYPEEQARCRALLETACSSSRYGIEPWAPALAERTLEQQSRLPRTIVHGDTDWSNLLITPDGPVLLDWESACIAPVVSDLGNVAMSVEDDEEFESYRRSYNDRTEAKLSGDDARRLASLAIAAESLGRICYYIAACEGGKEPSPDWRAKYYEPSLRKFRQRRAL